jgi:CRP/FNR family transcriptional regulator, cyclic AMP receptor protein
MKFAARDGSAARTLAYTSTPSAPRERRSATQGWYAVDVSATAPARAMGAPVRPRSDDGNDSSASGRRRSSATSSVTYLRGQEIFTAGQGQGFVYIVRSGCVRLYKVLPDGRSINIGLLGPNTVFTQEDSVDGIASGAVAEALVDSTLSIVETNELASIIADSPELAGAIVAGMSRRMTELQTLVEQLLVRDTSVRLATTLISLANRFGRPTADGFVAISLALTHQGLANMIGSNRVTVTRKLIDLQEGGSVKSLGRNALAVDVERLVQHVQTAGDSKLGGRDES